MLDDDQERINNLRAISNMPTEKEKPTSVFGIDTGGYENTLSPQENVVVNQLGKKLYGDKFDPSDISKDQWQAITGEAGSNLKQATTSAPPAGGPSEEEANPFQALADAQANQFLQMTEKMNPLTSGATAPGTQAQTNATAEQMIGASSTSPISQWLNEQSQAASQFYAPVQSAVAGEAQAQTQANQLEATGLKQLGTAEAAEMQSAPYSQLLSSLAADVPYKLLDNYNFTNLTGKNVPPGLSFAEQNLDINSSGASSTAPTLPSLAQVGTTSASAGPKADTNNPAQQS